jgi:hypothetical protein
MHAVRNAADAAYFRRVGGQADFAAASGNTAWNTEAEKRSVLSMLQAAREKYAKMAE